MVSALDVTQSVLNLIVKDNVLNVSMAIFNGMEYVLNKINIVFSIVEKVVVINLKMIIMSQLIEFVCPNNLGVFIKKEYVNIVNYHSRCIK